MSDRNSELGDKRVIAFIIFFCLALLAGGLALFWAMQKSRDAAYDSAIKAAGSDKDGALLNHKKN